MAFCTGCGASLTGAFCSKCGAPAPQSAASPAAAAAPAAAPAPVRRKTSPIVWVLLIILAFCALGIMGMIGTGLFLARRGPGYAIAKIIAAANPDAEVIRTDDGSGTITIRSRRTGKTVTLSFDEARRGRFRLEADDESGKHATVELGGSGNIPSWLPAYPGSTPQSVFAAKGDSDEGSGEGGNFTFSTPDPPSRVRSFYEDEAKRMGLDVTLQTRGADTSVLVAQDSDEQRKITVVITPGSETTVNVTYGRKR